MNILNTLCIASLVVVLVFIQQGKYSELTNVEVYKWIWYNDFDNKISPAFSIKCWDCRSDIDPKCADPFDNTTFAITDCSTRKLEHLPGVRATMCRKMRQKGMINFKLFFFELYQFLTCSWWSMEICKKLCLLRRAWNRWRWKVLSDENRNL